AAKEYIGRLTRPDRVASVDFDSVARLTRTNVGGPAHHLFSAYNNGIPDYTDAQADLDTIDQAGSTNFGAARFVANNELISFGIRSHAWAIILLTDGDNTCCPNKAGGDAQARLEAARAKANNITVFTIGLGPGADGVLLQEIATTTGGTYYAAPNAESIRFIYPNTNTQTIIRPDLGDQAQEVGNTSAYVQFWASQGAATPGAATAVRQPLNQAQARLQWGDVNASAGKLALAKFNVDSAQSQ